MKAAAVEAVYGLVVVGDDDVDEDEVGTGAEGGCGRVCRRALGVSGGKCEEGQSGQDEEEGE